MIKRVYFYFFRLFRQIKWAIDTKKIRHFCKNYPKKIIHIEKNSKILILAPHSDDEWIGCSHFIEHSNSVICSMDMVGGNDKETRNLRYAEMSIMAKRFNRQIIRIRENKAEALKKFILGLNPQYIAVPFFMDWHEDHIETMKILKESLNEYVCDIIMYQVSCPIPIDAVNFVSPLTKAEWKNKWKLFCDVYKTQSGFPWRRFAAIERAEGAYCENFAAEVFFVGSSVAWAESFNMLLTTQEKEIIKRQINDIYLNFRRLNTFFYKGNIC